jgi:uncharacterized protein YfaS (alpha-2-macroglobulin family)
MQRELFVGDQKLPALLLEHPLGGEPRAPFLRETLGEIHAPVLPSVAPAAPTLPRRGARVGRFGECRVNPARRDGPARWTDPRAAWHRRRIVKKGFAMRGPAVLVAVLAAFVAAPAAAEVPERRAAYIADTDLPGGDLRRVFDTTLEACERLCLADAACTAFTFNTRNGSCFPKAAPGQAVAYAGALSARILAAAPGAAARAALRRAELGFAGAGDIAAARAQAAALGRAHLVNDMPAGELDRQARAAAAAGATAQARGLAGAAAVAGDTSAAWLGYAEAILADAARRGSPPDDLAAAASAAINAWLRAEAAAQRHAILVVLAEAWEPAGRGRDALAALRLAQSIRPRDDTAAALARLAALWGFRIEDHLVQSDTARPRLCAVFSEPLIEQGFDYTPFVQLPAAGLSVEPGEWRQLCIAGLEHGTRVSATFRAGLPAADGQTLAAPVTITAYVRDRTPAVRIGGRGYVLPAAGETAIPVQVVNARALELALYRVSDRNLVRALEDGLLAAPMDTWSGERFADALAEAVWTGTAEVPMELNREVTVRLPMAAALAGQPPGVYVLRAAVPGADPWANPPAWQWFVVSDLGVTTWLGSDGLAVAVRSLASTAPRAGAVVTLLSRSNRPLGTAITDAEGLARFEAGLTRGTGGAEPALVTVQAGDDMVFLSLAEPEFDLSDRGVAGREAPPPIDVFLATDRGAYRAGETVHATALARDAAAAAILGLPLTAVVRRPDGVEYARQLVHDEAGGYVIAQPIGDGAPRGVWRLELLADPAARPLAVRSFLVEDFLPERIDATLTAPEGAVAIGGIVPVTVAARFLFGPPGADLAVEGEAVLRAAEGLAAFPGYRFGRADETFAPVLRPLDGTARTDARGEARLALALPRIADPGRPLEAVLRIRVAEGGGRPIEREILRPVVPAGPLIGIRPEYAGTVPEGAEARFRVLAVGTAGAQVPLAARWRLDRIETRFQWYQLHGAWNWEPVTTRSRIAEGTADLPATGAATIAAPVAWGEYELTVEAADGASGAASQRFFAGWHAPADATQTPDTLELSLDRPAYAVGDTARLRILPRAAGTVLVAVLTNRLVSLKSLSLPAGESVIDLPVTADWGSGAYVAATLLRPMEAAAGRLPARAIGIAHAAVDPGARRLSARIEAPPEADPRGPLPVAVRVTGLDAGEPAFVSLVAVDVGILNLTAHASPDPLGHYFGQRRLGVGIRDLYGRLIDAMTGARGLVRSGGDAGPRGRLLAPPPTEALLAFFTGPLAVGPDGAARAIFDLPAFNGTVRLMAVVWSAGGVGQAEAEVMVRDPAVVTASLPRFMAPGDRSRLLLEVAHVKGPAGRFGLDVTAAGVTLGAVPSGIDLAPQGRAAVSIPLTAGAAGLAGIEVVLTTPDGRRLARSLALPVGAAEPEVARTARIELAPGASFRLDRDALAGLDPAGARATLAIGALGRFDAPGLLAALDRIPWGCTEQIASRALPLLYLGAVAQAMGQGTAAEIEARIAAAIRGVLLNQTAEGGFGLWSAAFAGDLWLDAYVTDFLSRARALGHAVPERAFRAALDNLRSRANYAGDFERGGEDLAYALMVLAREGAAAVGDLRYFADVKGDAFATPLAAAQLGAALAAYGDQPRADAMFARAARLIDLAPEGQVWRSDYGTALRDAAGVLALSREAGSAAVDAEALAATLAPRTGAGALSTQEAAWLLLASHALLDRPGAESVTIDGAPAQGPLVRVLGPGQGAPVVVTNTGTAPVTLTLSAFGVAEGATAPGGDGYAIVRRHFTLDGAPAEPARVAAGTRLVTVLEITPFHAGEARLMVADPLPAGFEIDNPNLLRGGQIAALDWLAVETAVQHAEFRQDRFLAAIDRHGPEPFRLAYIVRAVSPGTFRHPAPSVEDMYRPTFRGWGASGTVTVTP